MRKKKNIWQYESALTPGGVAVDLVRRSSRTLGIAGHQAVNVYSPGPWRETGRRRTRSAVETSLLFLSSGLRETTSSSSVSSIVNQQQPASRMSLYAWGRNTFGQVGGARSKAGKNYDYHSTFALSRRLAEH